jgi:hypothetical protein
MHRLRYFCGDLMYNKKSNWVIGLLLAIVLFGAGASCTKMRTLTTGGVLTFSVDTLEFDTVFTAAGSFTNGFLIYNPQNEAVVISNIHLQNGSASFLHLNVDGFTGNNLTNIKIAAHDSAYVFVTIDINPNDSTNPYLITDSFVATMNGNTFYVPVTAYGQNCHYIVSDSFYVNTTWATDKPYVVVHSCVVGPGVTLNIPADCKVYMHQDARFFVYGHMAIDTTGVDSVVFQGDRLDRSYFGYVGYPGEWGGIYVVGGGSANISHAVIKNCGGSTNYYGFTAQPAALEVDSGGYLSIDHSTVENSYGHGLFSFQGNLTASACLVYNCGGNALSVQYGGYDSIVNCTFAIYGSQALSHINNPTVAIVNWLQVGPYQYIYTNMNVLLRNCIVWGSLDSELVADTSGSLSFGVTGVSCRFDHCDLKQGTMTEGFQQYNACINSDPLFKNPQNGDCHLTTGSHAIDSGISVSGLSVDLDNYPFGSGSGWDIGCYQFH